MNEAKTLRLGGVREVARLQDYLVSLALTIPRDRELLRGEESPQPGSAATPIRMQVFMQGEGEPVSEFALDPTCREFGYFPYPTTTSPPCFWPKSFFLACGVE